MNTYEANGCLFASIGTVVAGWAGWTTLGLFGAVAGAPLGLALGWFAGWFLVEVNFRHSIWLEIRSRRRALRGHFGEYWRPDRQTEWDRAVEKLREVDSLRGRVVAHFYYGVVLDVGNGFPALLTKLRYAEPFSENPPLGAEVVARIDEIKVADREIHLTQGPAYAEIRQSLRNSV